MTMGWIRPLYYFHGCIRSSLGKIHSSRIPGIASRRVANSSNDDKLPRVRSENPFDILGVSKSATYAEIKRRFLELALSHHPDHSVDRNEGKNDKGSTEFIKFRKAFEMLKEDIDGSVKQLEEGTTGWTDDEFKAWYYEETKHSDLEFSMDLKTRKEVINTYKQQVQGGLDRGGMWEMARRMAEEDEFLNRNKNKIKNKAIGLKDSTSPEKKSNIQRRRRKRK